VEIRSFVHKGLKKLNVEDSAKRLPPEAVDKLRAMLTFLQDMQNPESLRAFPLWKVPANRMKSITKENAMRMQNPVHPGLFLRTEIVQAHGLSVTDAAKVLGVSRPTLSSLLNGKADLSGDMAVRFEKAFGVDMDTLMRMQNSCDIAQTRKRARTIHVQRYRPRDAA
jgi:antitoxin HigA-1